MSDGRDRGAGGAGPVPRAPLDLSRPARYHVVGVGGPGMNPIAHVLAAMGHRVSGSDTKESAVLDRLRADGVDVHVGHDAGLVHGVDAVTASTAIPATNVELVEAAARGVTVLRRAGMLASICAQASTVAVAGTHGKTTTSSLLAMALVAAGLDPSFIIGGDVHQVGSGARWTGGPWMVVEADESDGTFLELPLHGTILTNVDTDHLDHFGSFAGIVAGFDAYLGQVPGPKVVCADDPTAARLAAAHGAVTYGRAAGATWRPVDVRVDAGVQRFTVTANGAAAGEVELPLRGAHNVLNATAALAMACELGASFADAARGLAGFGGVRRRFDVRGHHRGVTFVDDYAHLPGEIAAVLQAAANGGDGFRRVVAVFQPNRYKRMAVMSSDYRDAFERADLAVVTEIYPSGEPIIPGVTGRWVVDAIAEAHPRARVEWVPDRTELVDFLARELRDGDVCVSMGCGDVALLPDEVLAAMRARDAEAPA